MKNITATRIRFLRSQAKLTQEELAEKIGANRVTISHYESGAYNPSHSVIIKMAELFQVPADYILGRIDNPKRTPNIIEDEKSLLVNFPGIEHPEWKSVPLLGSIACGEPILAEENIEGYVNVTTDVHCDFVLRCKGDSMAPRLLDGDLVMIRIQPDVVDGQIAAVLIENEATLKHVYHLPNRSGIQLTADNSSYSPMVFLGEDAANIRILGLAVAYRRMLI